MRATAARNTIALISSVLALSAGLLFARAATAADISLRESVMHPLPLAQVPAPRELADQTYLEASKPDHAYDLYLPDNPAPRPLVLLIHGGAPAASGLRKAPLMRSWAAHIAARGGAAVAVVGWDGDRQLTEQIDAAYAQLQKRAGEYGIDAARPCIITFSAGVASVVPHALRSETMKPRCIAGLYGDWQPAMRSLPDADLRGLPILVVRAGRDEVIPDTSAPAFAAAAQAAGAQVEVLRQPQGLHVFEVRNPGAETTRIVEATLDFLRDHTPARDRPERRKTSE